MIRYLKNSLACATLLLYSCMHRQEADRLPFINKPDFTPEWISTNDPAYKTIHKIPDFSFVDQDGKNITADTVEGKIYVADFFFTHCGSICPVMTRNMGILQTYFLHNDKVMFL